MFLILFGITLILYWYGTRNFDYWKIRGVTHEKPIPFFGNNARQFLKLISYADIRTEMYRKYPNERMVGYFMSTVPELILRDLELIKRVMTTDFSYFYSRGLNQQKSYIEPLFKNLFFVDGDIWKLVRQRLSPAFTSGKLKAMFPLIVERAEKMQQLIAAKAGQEVDARDLMARYTTDFIGACGFGIDADSLNDEDSAFRKLGKRIFTFTTRDAINVFLKFVFPELLKHWHTFAFEIEMNTISLMRSVMKQRNYEPSSRNDFIDMLLELQRKGKIVGESIEKKRADGSAETVSVEFDEMLMAAQVFIFFAAGFETSSSAASYLLHELAFNPDVQKECQRELDEVLAKYENKLCYDAVRELKYLEAAFKESMRIFPSLGFLLRECVKKYTFPGTDITIDEGVLVSIPVHAIQTDPQYFPEPDKFKPERFLGDAAKDILKHSYLPFGDGPRACIGERLGLMQSLAGVAALLQLYTVEPSANSKRRPVSDPRAIITQNIQGGLPLKLVQRRKA